MDGVQLSDKLLEFLKLKIGKNQIPAEILSDILRISPDAAYRRLNGKVPLTFDEAALLCEQYNISLDTLINLSQKGLVFNYFALFGEHFSSSYADYLLSLEASLKEVVSCKGQIYISASDIPIGSLLRYPTLMAFKLYCWKNDMVASKHYQPFELKGYSSPYADAFKRFNTLYEQADCNELWSHHTFAVFIEALRFYKQLDLIPANVLSLLLTDLISLLDEAKNFAAEGQKSAGGRFSLYLSPLPIVNNFFLLEKSKGEMVSFLKMYAINSIWTSDSLYCEEQKQWFEAMIASATSISCNNPKERKAYFDEMKSQITALA